MADEPESGVREPNRRPVAGRAAGDAETVQSVDRALAIVELLLRAGQPLTVREVAVGTGINRTTAHRLLASLHRRGWIERMPGAGYRPSLRYLALVRASLDGRDFVDEVRPTMERLSLFARETVHLGVLDDHDILHIAKVDSPEIIGVSSRVGTRAVPHVTGLGKALLAAGPDEELEAYIARRAAPRAGCGAGTWLRRRRRRVVGGGALPGGGDPGGGRPSALRPQPDRASRPLHPGAARTVRTGDAGRRAGVDDPVRRRGGAGGGGLVNSGDTRRGVARRSEVGTRHAVSGCPAATVAPRRGEETHE
jgi:DNA-binding MarR family transcriptional regulator